MYRVSLPMIGFVAIWREAARLLASHGIAPDEVEWSSDQEAGLFAPTTLPDEAGALSPRISKEHLSLFSTVLCHCDPAAPALAYAALARHQGDRTALANPADPLTRRLEHLAKAVRRDIHKMHAFVRFREVPGTGPRRSFGAWFEPDHRILEAGTPFFAKRFADMDFTIATPQGIARFDADGLSFHPPTERPDLPDDASEALWAVYFENIFNPARIKLSAMRSEMPLKYWKNLPETRQIPRMLANAEERVRKMRDALPTQPPERAIRILDRLAPATSVLATSAPASEMPTPDMASARSEAASCRRCSLCEFATQTVWGDGDPAAPLMIVGEQPGDIEDLHGRPFVGPAGQLLREVMRDAQVGPAWMTNAVKHFKFLPRGKRRLHQSPNRGEIDHCRWWLDLERSIVAPRLTVALGASAAYALTGNSAALTKRRGRFETCHDGGSLLVSWHPSYILRLPDPRAAAAARAELLADLSQAAQFVAQ
jgi:uracil-DNA glycosylase